MIMNPWPILGAWAARDNNDDDDEDSAETRGHCAHGVWSRDSINRVSEFFTVKRKYVGCERDKNVKTWDVKFFREILFEVLINN